MPKITVILPVYNCEKHIGETIQSIIDQTYKDFELLIIDDCSTDSTVSIIESFNDLRIQLTKKEKNTGYTNSLNYAISKAKGDYIARMDGDDICMPQRFEKQVAFLDENQNAILCGSAVQIIGENTILRHPLNHEEIKVKLCFGTSFCHPSVMGRTIVFKENPYNVEFESAEDYELWTRLVFKGQLANLEDVLLLYRVHNGQVSSVRKDIQKNLAVICRNRMLNKLDLHKKISEEQMNEIFGFSPRSVQDCKLAMDFFESLKDSNKKHKIYEIELFNKKINSIKASFLRRYFTKQNFFKINSIYFFLRILTINDFLKISRKIFGKYSVVKLLNRQ